MSVSLLYENIMCSISCTSAFFFSVSLFLIQETYFIPWNRISCNSHMIFMQKGTEISAVPWGRIYSL